MSDPPGGRTDVFAGPTDVVYLPVATTVTLHSEEGRGSTIEIRLPLTLAIIDGFLVGGASLDPGNFLAIIRGSG